MYVILWEFEIAPHRATEFQSIYSPQGEWARLFAQAPGYLGTELLESRAALTRFLTIDRWAREDDFRNFQQDFGPSYRALDARCQSLTLSQRRLRAFVDFGRR